MKRIIPIALMAVLLGCTAVSETTTAKDGTKTKRSASSFLTAISGFKWTTSDPNGISSEVDLANYSADNQAIATLIGGLENIVGMALLANNTNNVVHSNLMAALQPMMLRRTR